MSDHKEGCICNFGPDTDGPDIDCPVHGIPTQASPQDKFVDALKAPWLESEDEYEGVGAHADNPRYDPVDEEG